MGSPLTWGSALVVGLAAACLGAVLFLTATDGPAAVQTLSDSGQGAFNPQVAIDRAGRATIDGVGTKPVSRHAQRRG